MMRAIREITGPMDIYNSDMDVKVKEAPVRCEPGAITPSFRRRNIMHHVHAPANSWWW